MTDFYQLDLPGQEERMERLARVALQEWGLASGSDLDLIKYRENAVFKVTLDDGARYALRIHRHAYHSDAELRSELEWMSALNEFGIDVPEAVPLPGGGFFAVVEADGVPEPRQVDLFEWIEGEQLGSVQGGMSVDRDTIRDVYHTIGQIAARLHNQATSWDLPPGFERHAWDADGLAGEQPLWGRFWELEALTDAQRSFFIMACDQVHKDLQAYGNDPANAGRYSMIHADFVVENLMVDGDKVRLIDFDDAGFGWHLFELATALYLDTDSDHFQDAYDALIKGYRENRTLPDEQIAHMPLFFAARSFTYLGWVHTRSETETAKELTPMLIDLSSRVVQDYLDGV
jgi:Ser/Thr protein kinase RdoA (MazF antagonist)